jgi:transcriptional regulator with XRE-family HTH domain
VATSPYLSNTEAADYLGVSPNTLNWWRARDRGPKYSKLGKLVKYHQTDLDTFAQADSVQPSRFTTAS